MGWIQTYGDIARPDLPKPKCRVKLVCGAPASGKSTYVKRYAAPDDIVIDIDAIGRERGFGRDRPDSKAGDLLRERNARLSALSREPPDRVAWVIMTAPSASLRRWWCETLGVRPIDMLLLNASREELQRRIMADPSRRSVQKKQFALVNKWLTRERDDDPGILKPGCDQFGTPLDPMHPWNREMSGND
jgi:5-methylcytosine-specific restriction protein A